MACEELNNHLMTLKVRVEDLAERFLGTEICNEVREFANNHPFVLGTICLTLFFSAVPIIFFICFAVITALIALICFICVEGCLLVFGGLLLAGIISFIAVLTSGVTVFFSVTFWFAQKFHRMFCHRTCAQAAAPPSEERQDADSSNT